MKSETKKINDKLDKAWSASIRSVNRCEYCGKRESLNAHHIFGRKNLSVRWDLNNGVCLCAGCHVFNTHFSAHQTPTLFTEWIINRNGQGWHDELKLKAHSTLKLSLLDKKQILHELSNV